MVERVVHLGFEVRVELVTDDERAFAVQLTRQQADELELDGRRARLRAPDGAPDLYLELGVGQILGLPGLRAARRR